MPVDRFAWKWSRATLLKQPICMSMCLLAVPAGTNMVSEKTYSSFLLVNIAFFVGERFCTHPEGSIVLLRSARLSQLHVSVSVGKPRLHLFCRKHSSPSQKKPPRTRRAVHRCRVPKAGVGRGQATEPALSIPELCLSVLTWTRFLTHHPYTGLFTFAVFLGLVSDEVKRSFRSIKDGLYPVRLHGHVLILNWSKDAIPLLRWVGVWV